MTGVHIYRLFSSDTHRRSDHVPFTLENNSAVMQPVYVYQRRLWRGCCCAKRVVSMSAVRTCFDYKHCLLSLTTMRTEHTPKTSPETLQDKISGCSGQVGSKRKKDRKRNVCDGARRTLNSKASLYTPSQCANHPFYQWHLSVRTRATPSSS